MKHKERSLDLRPEFMRGAGIFTSAPEGNRAKEDSTFGSAQYAHDVLFAESKTLLAFDLLAEKINQNLDYPNLLIENGVQGISTLDLYFDSEGNVDETKSTFGGDHRCVRGLLVRAAREGIAKWFRMDAFRVKKDQFRNQHFHADFSLSYTQKDLSMLEKTAMGSYTITRRHFMNVCANPMGVDLTCVAMKTYGAARNLVTDESRIQFEALRDRLESYDELELRGINAIIRG